MTSNKFRNALNAAPFRPFIIHLGDGQTIPVLHPDLVLVTGQGRTTIISGPADDWFATVALLPISHLEVPAETTPAAQR
jgi:hypothetical protein